MTYDEMREIVLDLPFDTMCEVYNNREQAILIYRPRACLKNHSVQSFYPNQN